MGSVSSSILLVFLYLALTTGVDSWSACYCHANCPPGCKLERTMFGEPYSKSCICNCNCNPSANPPPKSSTPNPVNPPPKSPVPTPPTHRINLGGFDLVGCLKIMDSYSKCSSEIGNLFVGGDLDPECCGAFDTFAKTCASGFMDSIPLPVREYCQNQ